MLRITLSTLMATVLALVPSGAARAAYTIKTANTEVPKELKQPIAQLLSNQSIQFLDDKGNLLSEVWFRKEVPAKATPAQVKNGLTYREIEETTLLGSVRFAQPMTDFRQQKIKAGVYTLRLGFQPMDGDHMGTAPYSEFCLLIPADNDAKPGSMTPKELQEMSTKASGTTHPAVFLLFPNEKPEEAPKLVDKGKGIWVVNSKEAVSAGQEKTSMGLGLALVGHGE